MGHCHSEDFSAIHQSHYITNISNDRKTFLEFFAFIWRGELMNIVVCLSIAFRNWLRQLDRDGWLRYATPPANLWKGSRTDPQLVEILGALLKLMGYSNFWHKIPSWLTLNGEKTQEKTEEEGERHWLCAVLLSSSKNVGRVGLKEPPTRACVLDVTPIHLPRFTQSSSRDLVLALFPSFIPSAYLKNARHIMIEITLL